MKFKIILGLALVLSGGLFGCSATKSAFFGDDTGTEQIKLPIKFAGYREFYTFVAQHTAAGGIPTDADTVFKLAADSTTKIVGLDYKQMPYVYVVESHYLNGEFDEIRGAQGNGYYYILRPLATDNEYLGGLELVGILEGNAYTLQHINGTTTRFVSYWHLSAGEHPESIYEWNGKFFAQIK